MRSTDRALAALAAERQRLARRLAAVREELWPRAEWPQGRRPPRDALEDALPPLPERPTWLWGRRLRAVCLRLLARCGTMPLRQLHALLHLHGFGVAGDQPVKVLADALGHESERGLAVRTSRGVYDVAPGYRPPPGRPGFLVAVDLPELDE